MKDNKIQKILDAWNHGTPVWLDGVKYKKDAPFDGLKYVGLPISKWECRQDYFSTASLTYFSVAELTPPEPPKKKTRKMTDLEKAYKMGVRWVFSMTAGDLWSHILDHDYPYMARILDEGRSLGEWVDCEVEAEG
jgi:hypothetical protein